MASFLGIAQELAASVGEQDVDGAARNAERLRRAAAALPSRSSAAAAAAGAGGGDGEGAAAAAASFRTAHVAEATEVFAAEVDAIRREEGFGGSARDVACLVDVLALGSRRAIGGSGGGGGSGGSGGGGGGGGSLERRIARELMA